MIIGERVKGMLANYDFVTPETLAYFERAPAAAARDADFALNYVKSHARTPDRQAAVLAALEFKCDVLWSMLDALHHAYVEPGACSAGCVRSGGKGLNAMSRGSHETMHCAAIAAPAAARGAFAQSEAQGSGPCSPRSASSMPTRSRPRC